MKTKRDKITRITKKFKEINLAIEGLNDEQFKELINTKIFNDLLLSILDPKSSKRHENLQDFFLKNKNRLSFLALLKHAINENYSFSGKVNDKSVFISPYPYQWLDGGVIFLQGPEKFAGLIGFYDSNKELSYAKSKRDFKPGEKIDPSKDLFFDKIYQKISEDNSLSSEQKGKIIDKLEEAKAEKDPIKKKSIFDSISKIVDRAWYQMNRAFWDSVLEWING